MSTQARPEDYARAIYDLALEPWTRQLSAVQRALGGNPELYAAANDAGQGVEARLKLLVEATPEPLGEVARKFLGTLLAAGQLGQLDLILAEFDRLVHRRAERRLARVTSAVPLTGAEREALQQRLIRQFGSDLDFDFAVDPALLGGIRLHVGDRVIDGSIAGKLSALRERLTT